MSRGNGIKPLGDLFAKYKNLKAPQQHVVSTFVEVVEDVLEITLKNEFVRYTPHSKTLSVTAPSPIKSELLLHKQEILTHVKGRLGPTNSPKDII